MKLRALLAACVVLAACSSAPQDPPAPQLPERAGVDPIVAARASGVAYRGVGADPPFVLDIYREDRIVLTLDSGAAELTFPKTDPALPRWYGEIYETASEGRRLEIYLRRSQPCPTDPGQHVIEVRLDGVELTGCGRDL